MIKTFALRGLALNFKCKCPVVLWNWVWPLVLWSQTNYLFSSRTFFFVCVCSERDQGLTNDTVNLNPTSTGNSGDRLRHCGKHCGVKVEYVCLHCVCSWTVSARQKYFLLIRGSVCVYIEGQILKLLNKSAFIHVVEIFLKLCKRCNFVFIYAVCIKEISFVIFPSKSQVKTVKWCDGFLMQQFCFNPLYCSSVFPPASSVLQQYCTRKLLSEWLRLWVCGFVFVPDESPLGLMG